MIFKRIYIAFFFLISTFFALESCEKKVSTSPKKSNLSEINRLIKLGKKNLKNSKYDSSYYYFNKAKLLCDIKKDTAKIIHIILYQTGIQIKQGDNQSAETTILEALTYLKNNPNPNQHKNTYMMLGFIYSQSLDFKLALQYYNLTLHYNANLYDKGCVNNNIAVVYMEMMQYPKALKILLPIATQKEILADNEIHSMVLDNLGYCYYKTGNIEKGFECMKQAFEIRKKRKFNWGLVRSNIHLHEYYKNRNPKLALQYALGAYKKATVVNNTDDRLESLKLLIQSTDGKQAKAYSEKYIHLNDSLRKARQIAKKQFTKIKYDSKLEKEENLFLKNQKVETDLELEKQKNRNLILSFLVIAGILASIFLYYLLKAINKKEKRKTTYETETRISKRLHDELANDVYQTLAFVETRNLSSNQNKESLLHNLDTIYARIRNISKENCSIQVGIHFSKNLKEMMAGYNTNSVTILTNGMDLIQWNALEKYKKIILYRVIQELLVNMKKHSQCSLAVFSFKKNKNNLQIDYSDNGQGAVIAENKNGIGLQNVENRILSIGGSITFDTQSDKGFRTSFTIPI